MRLGFVALTFLLAGCPEPEVEPDPSDTEEVDPGPQTLAAACADLDARLGVTRPDGWTPETHCELATPDVGAVFGDDVPTLEIRMSADEYAAMQDDLAALQGGFGADPCAELIPGDRCEVDFGLGLEPGECVSSPFLPDGTLFCLPDSQRPSQEVLDACVDKAEGDACSTAGFDGQCLADFLGLTCVDNSAWVTDPVAIDTGMPDTGAPPLIDTGWEPPPPPEAPCAELAPGDACASATGEPGVCARHDDGPLTCEIPSFSPADLSSIPVDAAAAFWPREPAYFHADLTFRGHTWTSVGLRYKGNNGLASSQGEKRPFRIKLDRWEDELPGVSDQRMYGFQDLSLSSNATDPSNLHQVVSAEVFRDHGVPAPESGFVRVTLDTGDGPRLLGLYAMTEIPDDPFLERAFGSVDGNLYKPDGRGAHFRNFAEGSFHRQNNEGASFTDVMAFIGALNADQSDREAWRDGLRATFDIDGFCDLYAINQAIGNWDTYGGLAHNFYLYADPKTDQLRFIPWDLDLSLDGSAGADLSLLSFGGEWPLLQAIARDAELADRYHDALARFADDELASGRLAERVDAWEARIAEVIAEEESVRPGAQEQFALGLESLRAHVDGLTGEVNEYLAGRELR